MGRNFAADFGFRTSEIGILILKLAFYSINLDLTRGPGCIQLYAATFLNTIKFLFGQTDASFSFMIAQVFVLYFLVIVVSASLMTFCFRQLLLVFPLFCRFPCLLSSLQSQVCAHHRFCHGPSHTRILMPLPLAILTTKHHIVFIIRLTHSLLLFPIPIYS